MIWKCLICKVSFEKHDMCKAHFINMHYVSELIVDAVMRFSVVEMEQ